MLLPPARVMPTQPPAATVDTDDAVTSGEASGRSVVPSPIESLATTVATAERRAITAALNVTGNNKVEGELIRALGTAAVERVLDAEGGLASFRRFQDQPAQRGRDLHAQLRRFLGTRAGRKVRYGSLLVDALELDRVPPALDLAVARAQG